VAERGHDAAGEHHLVAGGERRDEVAGDEEHEQSHQNRLARQAGDESGNAEGADDHTERVAGDEPPGRGLAHGEVGGHLGQQAHELGEPDSEAPDGEGE
jgi:hypothetical protein